MGQQSWQICVTLSAICDASTLPSLHIGSALLHLSYTSTLSLLLRSTLPLPLLYLDSTSLYLAALPLLYLYPTSTSSSLYYLSSTTSARFYLGSAFTSTSLYLSSTSTLLRSTSPLPLLYFPSTVVSEQDLSRVRMLALASDCTNKICQGQATEHGC